MKKKVGIITMYHNSINYGGVLQAYALQKFLEINNFEAKQICFKKNNNNKTNSIKMHYKDLGLINTIRWAIDRTIKKISSKIALKVINSSEKQAYNERLKKFEDFRKKIPHTKKIYDSGNIVETNDLFDIFCCGSDQIWKPGVVCPEYMLNFVHKNKYKMSYAASISKTNISEEEIEKMIPFLFDFNNISLREKNEKDILKNYVDKKIEWVVDPTLLLEQKDWEKLYIKDLVKEKYIFCYLLESNSKKYKIIKEFAKINNLKIVTIPFANGTLNLKDRNFGDIKIANAGPKEFISLIHDASVVITDSFHATVFSNIFKKNFFVLEREEATTMNSRITSLLEILNMKDRFINDKDLLTKKIECNFDKKNNFDKMKSSSIEYLLSIEKDK